MSADEGLVRLIRTHNTAGKLLELHAADSSGRCKVCRAGGDSSGRVRAPCSLFLAARAAQGMLVADPEEEGHGG